MPRARGSNNGRGFVGLLISTDPFGEVSSAELPSDSLPDDGDGRLLFLTLVLPADLRLLVVTGTGGLPLPDLGVGVPPPSTFEDVALRLNEGDGAVDIISTMS